MISGLPEPKSAAALPCWVDLTTSQGNRARDFYQRLFGWTFEANGTIGMVDGSPVCGLLELEDKAELVPSHWFPYFLMESFERLADTPPAEGELLWGPEAYGDALASVATVVDPGGAGFGLWEPGRLRGFMTGQTSCPAWFELVTPSSAQVARFYCGLFDCIPDTIAGTRGPYRVFTRPGVMLAGVVVADVKPYWRVYFEVENLSESVEQAERLDATRLAETLDLPIGRTTLLRDPVGALFGLIEPTREPRISSAPSASANATDDDNAGFPVTLSL